MSHGWATPWIAAELSCEPPSANAVPRIAAQKKGRHRRPLSSVSLAYFDLPEELELVLWPARPPELPLPPEVPVVAPP
jgi:hypothetical protein